jgi:hypothetical protein
MCVCVFSNFLPTLQNHDHIDRDVMRGWLTRNGCPKLPSDKAVKEALARTPTDDTAEDAALDPLMVYQRSISDDELAINRTCVGPKHSSMAEIVSGAPTGAGCRVNVTYCSYNGLPGFWYPSIFSAHNRTPTCFSAQNRTSLLFVAHNRAPSLYSAQKPLLSLIFCA